MPSGTPMTSTPATIYSDENSYENFLQSWFHRQEQILADLNAAISAIAASKAGDSPISSITDAGVDELVARALAHFDEFYEQKSRATRRNVFDLFSPTWSSSLESAFFWITGFRPGVLLQIVTDTVTDLSPQQAEAIDRLKIETRKDEKDLQDDLAKIQEYSAAPHFMECIRAGRYLEEDLLATRGETIDWLREALELVVANSDSLRVTTGARVVEILTPTQCLPFLVAAFRLQQGMRNLGMQKDDITQRDETKRQQQHNM